MLFDLLQRRCKREERKLAFNFPSAACVMQRQCKREERKLAFNFPSAACVMQRYTIFSIPAHSLALKARVAAICCLLAGGSRPCRRCKDISPIEASEASAWFTESCAMGGIELQNGPFQAVKQAVLWRRAARLVRHGGCSLLPLRPFVNKKSAMACLPCRAFGCRERPLTAGRHAALMHRMVCARVRSLVVRRLKRHFTLSGL